MMLSDRGILAAIDAGHIEIDGVAGLAQIQPSSVDLRLGEELLIFNDAGDDIIDPERRQEDAMPKRIAEQGFIVEPGEFLLGTTLETVKLGSGHAMQFTGKSSLARLGLEVHRTAGHIDPGFRGRITLEMHNVRDKPFRLRAGMFIGQVLVFSLDQPAQHPYGGPDHESRYMNQSTVTASRSWM